MNKLSKIFSDKLHTPVWLSLIMGIIILLRIPNFFEPLWNEGEATLLILGQATRKGLVLYKDIYTEFTPLLAFAAVFTKSLFIFKFVLLIWHICTIYIFWKLSNRLFPKNIVLQKISSFIFALFSTFPLLAGNIVTAELFVIGPIILAFYLLLEKDISERTLLLSGALIAFATLIKATAVLNIFVIIFYWITTSRSQSNSLREIYKPTLLLISSLLATLFIAYVFLWNNGSAALYLSNTYLRMLNGFFRFGILLVLAQLFIFWSRKKISRQFLFLFSWLIISLFEVLVSSSIQPELLLLMLAPVSFFFGLLISSKNMEQPLSIIPLTLFFFIPFYYNMSYYSTIDYYKNFANIATNNYSTEIYINSFGTNYVRNHKLADYLEQNTTQDDYIFVWGNTIDIYALSSRIPPTRYLTHSSTVKNDAVEEIIQDLNKNYPKYIVVIPESAESSQFNDFLHKHYGLNARIENAEVWRLLTADVRSLIAP